MHNPRLQFSAASIALPVSSWPTALAWYQGVLGCEVSHVDVSIGEVVELRLGLQRFSLWLDWGDPQIPVAHEREVRAPYLILTVPSLAVARKDLAARGAKLGRTPTKFPFVEDPFGNRLILVQPRRVRPTAAQRKRAVQYLIDSEAFRDALAEKMRASGIEGFEDGRAARAFAKRHGLRMPKVPRA